MTRFRIIKRNNARSVGWAFYSLLLLAMVAAWVFAHDFVAHSLNTKSNNKQMLMVEQAYALDWQFNKSDDVVSLFGSQWTENSRGLGFKGIEAQVSLNLRGQSVIKHIHQDLVVTLSSVVEQVQGLTVSIELADPHSGNFYHSPETTMNLGENLLDMTNLGWQVVQQNDQPAKTTSWQAMRGLSTLVLRFSNPNELSFTLEQVTIAQNHEVPVTDKTVQLPCDQQIISSQDLSITSFCLNSNFMTSLSQELSLSGQIKQLIFTPISTVKSWLWLLLSLMGVFTLVSLYAKPAKFSHLLAVVGVVYVAVAIVHGVELTQWEPLYRWPVILTALVLMWIYRGVFNTMILSARPLWAFFGLFALVLFWLGGFSFEFIRLLPMYLLWATLQQMILAPIASDFFKQRLAVDNTSVALLVGFIFAVLHSPNHTLMMATFVGGFFWSYSWLKYQNIYLNIISHSVLALLFYQAMPDIWLGSARVGLFFF